MKRKLSSYSDVELVKMLEGERREAQEAFQELYNRYSSMVHAYCFRIVGSEEVAEDIFQETFIKFYQNVRYDEDNTNIPGFLVRIARNLCLNYKRDKRNTLPIEDLDYLFHESQNYEKQELLDLITRSLDLLDEEYREAFVLREYTGLSYEQLAKTCNISLSNAKSRVFRAKQKIKAILQPYLNDLN